MEKRSVEELELFIDYGVQEHKEEAKSYLKEHGENPFFLNLFTVYYTELPEAREEPLLDVVYIDSLQGTYLVGVDTGKHQYLYCVDLNHGVYLGEFEKGIEHKDVLLFFGYGNNKEFLKKLDEFSSYKKLSDHLLEKKDVVCPVCFAAEGELHQLGCSVEVCPWCDGQLSKCNCRFEQLDIDEMKNDEELAKLEEKLEEKGRIPFAKDQIPAYLLTEDDVYEK